MCRAGGRWIGLMHDCPASYPWGFENRLGLPFVVHCRIDGMARRRLVLPKLDAHWAVRAMKPWAGVAFAGAKAPIKRQDVGRWHELQDAPEPFDLRGHVAPRSFELSRLPSGGSWRRCPGEPVHLNGRLPNQDVTNLG